MKMWHIVLVAIVFYFVGAYWGSAATTLVSKVQGAV